MGRPEQGEQLMKQLCEKLEEHGISDYVVVFSDPDSDQDRVQVLGSKFWRVGVGVELVEDFKRARQQEREEDGES